MKIKLINKKSIYQKAIIFGRYGNNSLLKNTVWNTDSFLNLTMDDGVQIEIDGESNKEKILEIYRKTFDNPLMVESIEYSSNEKHLDKFTILEADANGKMLLTPINVGNYLKKDALSFFPIVIERSITVGVNKSILFRMRPKQEIILKFLIDNVK